VKRISPTRADDDEVIARIRDLDPRRVRPVGGTAFLVLDPAVAAAPAPAAACVRVNSVVVLVGQWGGGNRPQAAETADSRGRAMADRSARKSSGWLRGLDCRRRSIATVGGRLRDCGFEDLRLAVIAATRRGWRCSSLRHL